MWCQLYKVNTEQNIYNILLINITLHNRVKLNKYIHFTCILCLLNNTWVKHNIKSVHVSNLFWSRECSSAKEICKYPSFSKVGGNYPLDLKIIWSSDYLCNQCLPPLKFTVRCAGYNIYVIKFVIDLWQLCGFLQRLGFLPPQTFFSDISNFFYH